MGAPPPTRRMVRGTARPSDLGTALDELGVHSGQSFDIAPAPDRDPHLCVFCGVRVNPIQDPRRVSGFAAPREQGGTNALALRETAEEWAHPECIEKQKRGIHADQLGAF